METKLIAEINKVLKEFPQYWSGDKLNKSAVINDIIKKDPRLINRLVSSEKIRSNYVTDFDGVSLFDSDQLISILKYREYWSNSYTKYRNKIGLTDNGNYIDYSTDVILEFPFKDCVLEGGLKDEEDSKNEVYYNEVIGRDEIDRLFSPKVFTNTKRYKKDCVETDVSSFSDNENLIIKGNNLIALHSLKKRYFGKVKCIFIDPPYYFINKKPADTFNYNSNFKLSSWLVFMKSRLEIAKQLMHDEGVLYITISDSGAHYLKVLCDSIFHPDDFIADIIWQSRKSVSSDTLISTASTHILTYAKNKKNINKKNFKLALDVENFKFEDELGNYRIDPFDAPNVRKNLTYEIENPNTGEIHLPPAGRCWSTGKKEYEDLMKNNRIQFGMKGTSKPQLKVYLKDAIEAGKGNTTKTIWNSVAPDTVMWIETDTTTNGTKHQKKMFGSVVFDNPKPEDLVKRAIELSTNEKDLVLDFFLGSGTTAATAHKMGRQYIGIEQMDYINDISVPRLQKVLQGEEGGISKDVNWKGGGEFIYTELLELNYSFIDKISQAKDDSSLKDILIEMNEKAHLNFQVDLEALLNSEHEVDNINYMVSFDDLNINEKKKLLIEILEKNQLYVCSSEINDNSHSVSESDKAFTNSFYQKD